MRNVFKDYSFIGVVLLFSSVFLGLFFRFLGLTDASAWGDEVATLYYSQNLVNVFLYESHTPFFYFLGSLWTAVFSESIVSLRFFSLFLSLLLFLVCGYWIQKKKGPQVLLGFVILWLLWPTHIIFARQARHYDFYAQLTLLALILWEYRQEVSKYLIWFLFLMIQLLQPLGIIVVWFLLLFDSCKNKLSKREFVFYGLASLPVMLYYAIRFFVYGKTRVLSNISWISTDFLTFQKSLLCLFAGESHPLTSVFHLNFWLCGLFLLLVVLIVMSRKKIWGILRQSTHGHRFILLIILTVGIVEIVSYFVTNIRVSRYYIFLVPMGLYAALDYFKDLNPKEATLKGLLLFFLLTFYNMFYYRPWQLFAWDDQYVEEAKFLLKELPHRPLVVCASVFQLDYYFQQPYIDCSSAALKHHYKQEDFYLFNLNGHDQLLMLFLLNEANIDTYKKFGHSTFMSVTYPKSR